MGNNTSLFSKTSQFFIRNFKSSDSFVLDFEEYTILFTIIKEETISFEVKGELLIKPHKNSVVLINEVPETNEFYFDVFYDFEGFFNLRSSKSCYDFDLLVNRLEKFVLDR